MKRNAKLILNIGLENNPFDKIAAYKRLKQTYLFEQSLFKDDISTYKGKKERTLIVETTTSYRLSKVIEIIENLCNTFEQECIAIQYNQVQILIYNPTTKLPTDEQLAFDKEVFKTL